MRNVERVLSKREREKKKVRAIFKTFEENAVTNKAEDKRANEHGVSRN